MKKTYIAFAAFILIQFLFAGIYLIIYRIDKNQFYFLNEIESSEKEMQNFTKESQLESVEDQINITHAKLLSYYSITDTSDMISFFKLVPDSLIIWGNFSKTEKLIPFNKKFFSIDAISCSETIRAKYRTVTIPYKCLEIRIFDSNYCEFKTQKIQIGGLEWGGDIKKDDYFRLQTNKNYLLFSLRRSQFEEVAILRSELNDLLDYKKQIQKIKVDFPLWNYFDFLYFSFYNVSGSDILPNSTLIRFLSTMQRLIELVIFGVLINIFLSKKRVMNKNPVQKEKTVPNNGYK